MEKIEVGSIIYLVIKQKIMPCQVVGETTTKTLTGTQLSYSVKGADNSTIVISASPEITTEYYMSLADVRESFVKRASTAIDKMLSVANEIAKKSFGNVEQQSKLPEETTSAVVKPVELTDAEIVELPDGTKAKIKMSPEVSRALAHG